ncbi:hypothetical protein [Amycolatopsis sp. MEPSY49]|uniref:hypothetical protein n=1 Tax=Amycolatopsis sp. MEPSY49 TaxID=3151600 RepID=UPI003EF43C51
MTPSHDDEFSSNKHGAADPPTIPIPLPRRRTKRRANLGHRRPPRPSTVWPCAQDDLLAGTGLLAGWLLTAIIKLVTTYTRPGQRVLLLEPAHYLAPSTSRPTRGVSAGLLPGPYAGLHEAGWTVVRLGRGVQTQTAVAGPGPVDGQFGDVLNESEADPEAFTLSAATDELAGLPVHRGARPEPTSSPPGPDRYDLVIAAVEPRALDWFRPADWADLLTSTGTLAVITHGHRESGRLTDPAGALLRAAHRVGLRYHDRIALLRIPVRDGTLAVSTVVEPTSAAPARHLAVHDDLLVFTRQPEPMSAIAEGGDLR